MESFNVKISRYIEKNKKSSLSKTDITEVLSLLKELLNDDSASANIVIDTLLNLHYSITAEFFKTIFNNLEKKVKTDLVSNHLEHDKIYKKTSNFSITRNFVIVSELLQTSGNDEYIHKILKTTAEGDYDKDKAEKVGEFLAKFCFSESKGKLFSLDYSTWEKAQLEKFLSWINNAIKYTTDDRINASCYDFIKKHSLIGTKGLTTTKDYISNVKKKDLILNDKEKVIALIDSLKAEISKILKEKARLSKEIKEARLKLVIAEKEKEALFLQLSEAQNINMRLQNEIEIRDRKIKDAEIEIIELDNRLRNAFNADKLRQNQELVSLKEKFPNY